MPISNKPIHSLTHAHAPPPPPTSPTYPLKHTRPDTRKHSRPLHTPRDTQTSRDFSRCYTDGEVGYFLLWSPQLQTSQQVTSLLSRYFQENWFRDFSKSQIIFANLAKISRKLWFSKGGFLVAVTQRKMFASNQEGACSFLLHFYVKYSQVMK
jgi:hypothetical protein